MKLSLCIPTYNFGRFIAETLHSILGQKGAEQIEVVIVDGASTDNTSEIVGELKKQYPQIKYFRLAAKGGIDRDMAKSVEFATGDYCWLFSSDDIMKNGAIEAIQEEMKLGYDIFLCKHMECKFDMSGGFEYPVLKLRSAALFELENPEVRAEYFKLAINTEAFFSFMGGTIIKKTTWDSVPLNEAFVGSCWAHVARIFEIMQKRLTVKYLAKPYLNRRGDNDSFLGRGLIVRYGIGIDGYHKLADIFFGHDSLEAAQIRRVVRSEFGVRAFLLCKLLCRERPAVESKALLDSYMRKAYGDGSWWERFMHFIYITFPIPLYRMLRYIYRVLRYKDGIPVRK